MALVHTNGITIQTRGTHVLQRHATQDIQTIRRKQTIQMQNAVAARICSASMVNVPPAVMSADAKSRRACTKAKFITWKITSASQSVPSIQMTQGPDDVSETSVSAHVIRDTQHGNFPAQGTLGGIVFLIMDFHTRTI